MNLTRIKIDWFVLFSGFILISAGALLAVVMFLGLTKMDSKKCNCAKICNSEFKCGLKECPTGKSR